MEFTRVGVVGLGTMGSGIVEVFAKAGLEVVGVEQSAELLERGRGIVEKSTGRAVERGKLDPAERDAVLGRISYAESVAALDSCDLVVEAVVERMEVKAELFAELDRVLPAHGVLATNTSSLSITAVAAATERPERVVGMHFFNPAPVLRLVEVVSGVATDPAVVADVSALARRLGKTPIACGDRAGFIANTLLFGYLNHAVALLDAGVDGEELDAAMVAGAGFPMGPLALLDLIGLDTAQHILRVLYAETRLLRHAPSPLLDRLVTAGRLGRKSGAGFHDHGAGTAPAERAAEDAGTGAVREIGLVGAGELVDTLAERWAEAGLVVVRGAPGPALADVDAVLWFGAEDAAAEAFAELGRVCKPDAVLLSAAAETPVAELAAASGQPERVAGLRFPGTTPGAVAEVVRTLATGPEAERAAGALAERAGAVVVRCADRAGGIVDALVHGYVGDAVRMLAAGYASSADIDQAMALGCRLPGPFALLDQIGPEAVAGTLRRMYAETGDPGLVPSPLLRDLALPVR